MDGIPNFFYTQRRDYKSQEYPTSRIPNVETRIYPTSRIPNFFYTQRREYTTEMLGNHDVGYSGHADLIPN